jgi:hypothetical protein
MAKPKSKTPKIQHLKRPTLSAFWPSGPVVAFDMGKELLSSAIAEYISQGVTVVRRVPTRPYAKRQIYPCAVPRKPLATGRE